MSWNDHWWPRMITCTLILYHFIKIRNYEKLLFIYWRKTFHAPTRNLAISTMLAVVLSPSSEIINYFWPFVTPCLKKSTERRQPKFSRTYFGRCSRQLALLLVDQHLDSIPIEPYDLERILSMQCIQRHRECHCYHYRNQQGWLEHQLQRNRQVCIWRSIESE